MLMEIARMAYRDDPHDHPGQAFEQWLIVGKILANWDDGEPPIIVSDIAKQLNIPRTNVGRGVDGLMQRGAIRKGDDGDGYTVNLNYYTTARIDGAYFVAIREAIFQANDELRELVRTMPPP
jgi:DNA-binding IclR family transcriptional regulator